MDIEKETWNVIDSYFRDMKDYMVKHHLDSYNDFISLNYQNYLIKIIINLFIKEYLLEQIYRRKYLL